MRLLLGAATLIAGERRHNVERRAIIIRKLSEFTWDFLLYMVLDFQPVLAAVDILCFLTGPLHNRRLGKQLSALSDGELLLKPGERRKALLGFQGVPEPADRLQLLYDCGNGDKNQIQCDIRHERG